MVFLLLPRAHSYQKWFYPQGLPASESVPRGINPEGRCRWTVGGSISVKVHKVRSSRSQREAWGKFGRRLREVKWSGDQGLKACHVGGHKEPAKAFHMWLELGYTPNRDHVTAKRQSQTQPFKSCLWLSESSYQVLKQQIVQLCSLLYFPEPGFSLSLKESFIWKRKF